MKTSDGPADRRLLEPAQDSSGGRSAWPKLEAADRATLLDVARLLDAIRCRRYADAARFRRQLHANGLSVIPLGDRRADHATGRLGEGR